MAVVISEDTLANVAERAQRQGLSAEAYLVRLMAESDEAADFTIAVESGLRDLDQGRVSPAREALLTMGQKFGFSR